jgi:hypothetical protein
MQNGDPASLLTSNRVLSSALIGALVVGALCPRTPAREKRSSLRQHWARAGMDCMSKLRLRSKSVAGMALYSPHLG